MHVFFKEFSFPWNPTVFLSPLWTDIFLYVSNVSLFPLFQFSMNFFCSSLPACVAAIWCCYFLVLPLQRCVYNIKHTKSKYWNLKNKIKMFHGRKKYISVDLNFCMIATFSTVELKWQLQLRRKYKLHSTSTDSQKISTFLSNISSTWFFNVPVSTTYIVLFANAKCMCWIHIRKI